MANVLIVDDHALVRAGLMTVLGMSRGMEVVGEAENGRRALALARQFQPDLVTMDLHMPVMCGADATRQIVAECPGTKVLVVTTYCTSDEIGRALEAGAHGAVSKTISNDELTRAANRILAGRSYIGEDVFRILQSDPIVPNLSPRQREVLEAVARGLSNRDIAILLGISIDMVKEHVNAIFVKLGVANRTEAVAFAIRKHIL